MMDDLEDDCRSETIDDCPWVSIFSSYRDPFYGAVETIEQAQFIVREFGYHTCTSYVVTKSTKNFGNGKITDADGKPHTIRFRDDQKIKHGSQLELEGKPFMIVGSRMINCHQGPDYHKRRSEPKNSTDKSEHQYQQAAHKKKNTGTKKRGCPATIFMREVIAFPQYKASNLKAPIDQRVVDNTYKLIEEGFYNVNELKRNNNLFVKSLFGNTELPKAINRKFYPSREDFRQMVARRRRKVQQDLLDQELLDKKIKEWKLQYPADNWFFRPSAFAREPAIEGEEIDDSVFKSLNQSFLLVYQSEFQKHLLARYGQELVFLDATYKTMKYAIPLFFLCVHTNCGYAVAGSFLIENEDTTSLAEALQVFQGMNPAWTTKGFMVDASEIEATAITATYPNVKIFLCDFHRKQAWIRWLSSIKNGVASQKDEILELLNAIAESSSDEDYKSNLKSLEESTVWKDNPKLQDYIQRQWLSAGMVQIFGLEMGVALQTRDHVSNFVINTNNGVEAQNHVFKQEYLAPYRTKTLSGLMTILVQDFFTDAHRKYLDSNISSSEGWRTGSSNIPQELHHKPKHLISHIRDIMQKAANIGQDMVKKIDENSYEVQSSSIKGSYALKLKDNMDMPFCSCFQFRKTHLLCKHFAAVFYIFGHNWSSLPDQYTSIPIFNLDPDCLTFNVDDSRSVNSEWNIEHATDDEDICMINVREEAVSSLTILQKHLREELTKISTLSYIIEDQRVLEEQTVKLKEMTSIRRQVCPQKEGLLLEPEPIVQKQTSKSKARQKIFRGLPLRKKRFNPKKALHRMSTTGLLNIGSKKVVKRKVQSSTKNEDSVDDPCRKRDPEVVQHTLPDHTIPEKKIKLSSSVSSPSKDKHGQARNKLKLPVNFRGQRPSTKCNNRGLGKQQNSSPVEEQKFEEKEIRPLLIEYMKKISEQDWENLIVKGNYVGTGLAGRRAGAALEMVKEDDGQLLKDVKNAVPKKFHVSDLCLVEILFVLMARMVNDDVIKLKVDPKDTDKRAHEAMKELLQCLKDNKESSDVPSCSSIKNSLCSIGCEENFIKRLKDEGLLKSSSYMLTRNSCVRYEVEGETLEGKDLRTLQGSRWLNDKVMNAYMGILKYENNMEQDGHVFVLPSYMAVLWEQNRFDTWFYSKVSLSRYTWIFQPINKCQNHWILLAAHVPEMSVSILDSMAGSNDKYIANWRKYMKMRSGKVGELSGDWTNGNLQSSRQKDGNSCGPFVLMNALALSKGIEPASLSQRSALVMREHVTCKLIQAAKKPKAQRTICDMLECKKPSKDSWVQCEVCGRWLHFTCVGVKNAPQNDYVCIICNAQYK